MNEMICPNCAKDVENDAKFCGFCGYKLENEGKKASIIEENQPEKMDDALLIKGQQTEVEKKSQAAKKEKIISRYALAGAVTMFILNITTGIVPGGFIGGFIGGGLGAVIGMIITSSRTN